MTAPIFDIRHGDRVAVLNPTRTSDGYATGLRVGQRGIVKAMRADDGVAHYLVKWDRKAWPVVLCRCDIEAAP